MQANASPTALIFGASGQDGHYLGQLLEARGMRSIGVSRSPGPWVQGDVANFADVEALVGEHRPDYIFHLAANSTTRHDTLFEHHATIAGGTLNILEVVRRQRPQAKVFLSGSGVQFRNRGEPISEHDEFEGSSGYSIARIQSVYAARYYRTLGVRAYVGYLFHHESPLRKPHHVSQKIAQAARRIASGSPEVLEIGDITVRKEWAFAGDIAAAMLTLVEQETVFEATLGTGIAHSIEDWLEACFRYIGRNWRDHVKTVANFRADYPLLVSNPATIRSLGWAPAVDLPKLAELMMSGGNQT